MFTELYELACRQTLLLTLSANPEQGTLNIVVCPKLASTDKGEASDAALLLPLNLCGTPQEFDAEFVTLLKGYRMERQSLASQVSATCELLAAAKEASKQKGTQALAKACRPGAGVRPATCVQQSLIDDEGDEADFDGEGDEGLGHESPASLESHGAEIEATPTTSRQPPSTSKTRPAASATTNSSVAPSAALGTTPDLFG